MKTRLLVMVSMLMLTAGCDAEAEQQRPDLALGLETLSLPTAPGSGEPNLTVGPEGVVYVSWIDPLEKSGHAFRFARYQPERHSWSEPQTIATGEAWFVNWADVPSLAVTEGLMTAHWLVRSGPDTYAYHVYVATSVDGGTTWSGPQVLHEDRSDTEHGFVTMVPDGKGAMQAVWLDGNKFATADQHMTLRARGILPDSALGREVLVDDLTCDCCPTSAVTLPEGLMVVYRDRTHDEVRDIYRVRYVDGAWGEPEPVYEDGWHLKGCPVNGPAADAMGAKVVVAWFTAAGDTARVRVAFSEDAGHSFAPPMRVDEGVPLGRVDAVMLPDGTALVSWMEERGKGKEAGIFVRRVATNGEQSNAILVQATTKARASGYPRMALSGEDLVFAWTHVDSVKQVLTGVAILPKESGK